MPVLQIFTNVSSSKINNDLLVHLTDVMAKALEKPREYMAIHIVPDQHMSFAGSVEPTAQVKLASIGRLGVEENKVHRCSYKLGITSLFSLFLFVYIKKGSECGHCR